MVNKTLMHCGREEGDIIGRLSLVFEILLRVKRVGLKTSEAGRCIVSGCSAIIMKQPRWVYLCKCSLLTKMKM